MSEEKPEDLNGVKATQTKKVEKPKTNDTDSGPEPSWIFIQGSEDIEI